MCENSVFALGRSLFLATVFDFSAVFCSSGLACSILVVASLTCLSAAHWASGKRPLSQPLEASHHLGRALKQASQFQAFPRQPVSASAPVPHRAPVELMRVWLRLETIFPPTIFRGRYSCRQTGRQGSGSASASPARELSEPAAEEEVVVAEEVAVAASWPLPAASAPVVFPRAWAPASSPPAAERAPP